MILRAKIHRSVRPCLYTMANSVLVIVNTQRKIPDELCLALAGSERVRSPNRDKHGSAEPR